jgi:hypothetical protein
MSEATAAPPSSERPPAKLWQKLLPWAITAACFAFLYGRIDAAAERQGQSLAPYLAAIFARVEWGRWLALMIPYSILFFLIDSWVLWRVVNWFNTRIAYADILPVRASTYVLSILNEQIGKGAMAIYLNRRDGVPGWQVGSSMLFIMFCEFYYLLGWATIGTLLRWDSLPGIFHNIPLLAFAAAVFFVLWIAYFRGRLLPNLTLRDRDLLHAFRRARPSQYLVILAMRSPALLAAVAVYTWALGLFGISSSLGEILGYLPVIFFGAAVPGPMRAVAITMWTTLFPDQVGEAAAFGLCMHNFFIFFNAAIGLLFMRRAQREIFGARERTLAPETER